MKPPTPNAIACAAPHKPMRTPSRPFAPVLARLIIEPMAATANAPLAMPSANTLARSGQPGDKPPSASASSASAEARQPPIVHSRNDPKRRRPLAANATSIIPVSTPPFWIPDSCVDSPGVKPNTVPANGSRIRSCALKASIETKTKMVKRRACGSSQTCASAARNGRLGAPAGAGCVARPSTPITAKSASTKAAAAVTIVTATSRSGE